MKLVARQDLYIVAVVGLIEVLRRVGRPRLNELAARGAGVAAYHLSFGKRRRIEENVSRCLGVTRSAAERQQIVRRVFYETWRELLSWADADATTATMADVDIEGFQHLEQAVAAGCGTILWESNGFGRRKAMRRILRARGIALHQVAGPHDLGGFLHRKSLSRLGHRIQKYYDRSAQRFVADTVHIPTRNSLPFARMLLAKLRDAAVLCLTGDGEEGVHRVSCEFLSGISSFSTGAVSLARLSGARLLPVFCIEANGRTRVIIEGSLSVDRRTARDVGFESSLGQFAKVLEDHVRRYPGQYRNWHLLDDQRPLSPVP